MIVIEVSEDKYGKLMKDVSCIEDKLKGVKEVFENESFGQRKRKEYPYEGDYDYRRPSRDREYYNRYM